MPQRRQILANTATTYQKHNAVGEQWWADVDDGHQHHFKPFYVSHDPDKAQTSKYKNEVERFSGKGVHLKTMKTNIQFSKNIDNRSHRKSAQYKVKQEVKRNIRSWLQKHANV